MSFLNNQIQSTKWFVTLAMVLLLIGSWLLSVTQPAYSQSVIEDINDEIIYIDPFGVIRVLDTTVLGSQQISWFSPEGDFTHLAAGDFNDDGDFELAAVKGRGAETKLIIYDPVVNSMSVSADGIVAGVPWRKLYERRLGLSVNHIEAGNLDDAVPGDEIIYILETGSGKSRIVILSSMQVEPIGSSWFNYRTVDFDRSWDHIAVGEIYGDGPEEIVLCDDQEGDSKISAYQLNDSSFQNRQPFFRDNSAEKLWKSSVIGQVYAGGYGEVVALRNTTAQGPDNVFIFQYRPEGTVPEDTLDDYDVPEAPNEELDDGYFFNPSPRMAFLGNINGTVNNERDDELMMVRQFSGNGFRLLARNRGSDSLIPNFEQTLDGDSGYRVGAAGDVDGDGLEEIVIMRDNRIRIYQEPNSNMSTLREDLLATDKKTLLTADLDRNGFRAGEDPQQRAQSYYLPLMHR